MEIKEIRTLTKEEREEYAKIDMLSFARTAIERPKDEASEVWGVFADKLCAGMMVFPFTMEFDARQVQMHGLANIATLPEYREKGIMPAMLKACLEDMREKGVVFAGLYPFLFDYYRRFGFEMVCRSSVAEIPMELLAHLPKFAGTVRQFEAPEDGDFSVLEEVYNKFKTGKQFALTRDTRLWKKLAGHNALTSCRYTYVLYDGERPTAYVVFEKAEVVYDFMSALRSIEGSDTFASTDSTMLVKELAYTDTAALWEMFSFLRNFRSKFARIRVKVPFAELMLSELPESDEITQLDNKPHSLMLRILNLPTAFELIRAPTGAGSVVIDVRDEFLPQNAGRYELTWADNKLSADIIASKPKTPPDLETDITTLTQLITGFLTPGQALHKGGVKINSKPDLLETLFPAKESYIYEEF